MLRNRKKPFIETNKYAHTIVEIETLEIMSTKVTSEMKMVIMENAIQRINKDENFITSFLNYQYYLLKCYFSFLIVLFCKKFIIHKIFYFQNEENYLYNKPSTLYLYDSGIYFNKSTIPYENILTFGISGNLCQLQIFAKIENKDLTLSLDKQLLKVVFNMDNPGFFLKCMKNNMYYHIKYNKVNETAIQFYFEHSSRK